MDLLPLRLELDGAALAANWRDMARRSGRAACGAAVKADGYGLDARAVATRLSAAGCRDFYVATWSEADEIGAYIGGSGLSVLHGVRVEDMPTARASAARPVLNTAGQIARWRETGRPCDVMVDTGMNRLGLTPREACSGLLEGLQIDTLMSHLACADEPGHALNEVQQSAFTALASAIPARRYSLANSAGICLGADYSFDLTRPGLALYGGSPSPGVAMEHVVRPFAQVLQTRRVHAGETVGYGATFTASGDMTIAIVNLGYADGYLRTLAGQGMLRAGTVGCPVVGRISMDLTAVDISQAEVGEGDWLEVDYDLPTISAAAGLSQYELLTGLGHRYQRRWS